MTSKVSLVLPESGFIRIIVEDDQERKFTKAVIMPAERNAC